MSEDTDLPVKRGEESRRSSWFSFADFKWMRDSANQESRLLNKPDYVIKWAGPQTKPSKPRCQMH